MHPALLLLVLLFLSHAVSGAQPGTGNCTLRWSDQFLDNFGWSNTTFKQRVFVYDAYFRAGGPILFYTGNEANVELFVNNTGWPWTYGPELGALLVFAEHRFFGSSIPDACKGATVDDALRRCGNFLSSRQAMADFARNIVELTAEYGAGRTITLGGSYGGMLAAWMRMTYPSIVAGAIASSAPIACIDPGYDPRKYWAQVSFDATTAAGSPEPECHALLGNATAAMRRLQHGGTKERQQLHPPAQRLCLVQYNVPSNEKT